MMKTAVTKSFSVLLSLSDVTVYRNMHILHLQNNQLNLMERMKVIPDTVIIFLNC